MKTGLLFAYLLGAAIVRLSLSQDGTQALSYHSIRSKKIIQQEEIQRSSYRLLREQISRRTSSLGETVNHIWSAAVEETADSTSSTHTKCRLADGTVIVNGEPYYGKGKGKGKKGSKSSKSSEHIPSFENQATELDSVSPVDCYGKGKSCKIKKMKYEDGTHKSKLSMKSKKSKSSKSGKGKYQNSNIPYCHDLTMSPTTSPTTIKDANTSPPTDQVNPNGVTDTPSFAPTTVDEFARCNGISSGTGDTSGEPDQLFKLYVLVESGEALEDGFAEKLNTAMRTILALASGCKNTDFSMTTRRRLQDNPAAVELEGFELVDLAGLTCEQAFGVGVSAAVCTAFESLVRAFGGEIVGDIEQICEDFGPQLAAALDVERIQCVVDKVPFDILVPTSSPTTAAPTGPPASPTVSPTEDGGTPDDLNRDGSKTIEAGGWIIMAAGILVLFSLCLCYFCNRRADKERAMAVYAKTYDDGDSSMADDANNANEVATPRAIFAHPEHDNYESDKYESTDVAPTDEEEEYPVQHRSAPTSGTYFDPVEEASSSSPVEDILLHEKGQVCSSPSCRLCEDRRREGSAASSIPNLPNTRNEYPERGYIQDDTVEL